MTRKGRLASVRDGLPASGTAPMAVAYLVNLHTDRIGEHMASHDDWRRIIASALDWEQAHAKLDSAVDGLAPEQRGIKPEGFPHSVWMLVEHIRLTQHDLLDFCRNANYEEVLKWPDDYWPKTVAPSSDAEWTKSLEQIRDDTRALKEFTETFDQDLTLKIPRGTGQTYLRTILVAVDHNSYHVGQILAVRRLIGSWTKS